MMIESVSKNISNKLGERLNKTEEEKNVLNYGIFIILHTSLAIILTVTVGIITNTVLEIIIITISAAWMKRYSGGVHANTPNRCLLIGVIITLILAYVNINIINFNSNKILGIVLILGNVLSYAIIYRRCPVGTKNKPLNNVRIRNKLRKKAFTLLNFYTIIIIIGYVVYLVNDTEIAKNIVTCIWLGLLLQVSMLTSIGKKIIYLLDLMLEKLNIN